MRGEFDGELVRNKGLQPVLTEDWIGYLNLKKARALVLADVTVHSALEAEMTLKIYWPKDTGRGETECVLQFNRAKQTADDPDLQGAATIDDQHYGIGAWISMPPGGRKGFKLRLTEFPEVSRSLRLTAMPAR